MLCWAAIAAVRGVATQRGAQAPHNPVCGLGGGWPWAPHTRLSALPGGWHKAAGGHHPSPTRSWSSMHRMVLGLCGPHGPQPSAENWAAPRAQRTPLATHTHLSVGQPGLGRVFWIASHLRTWCHTPDRPKIFPACSLLWATYRHPGTTGLSKGRVPHTCPWSFSSKQVQ